MAKFVRTFGFVVFGKSFSGVETTDEVMVQARTMSHALEKVVRYHLKGDTQAISIWESPEPGHIRPNHCLRVATRSPWWGQ